LKFISDTKWLSLITETYLEGLDAHTNELTSTRSVISIYFVTSIIKIQIANKNELSTFEIS
jgi:hypothetical protein